MHYFSRFLAKGFRHQQQHGFIGFVTKLSAIGVGVGCAALILLLSVMNGFERELKTSLLSLVPHAEFIQIEKHGIQLSPAFKQAVQADDRVEQIYQVNRAVALLQYGNAFKSLEIIGGEPNYWQHKFSNSINISKLESSPDGIYLAHNVLSNLNIQMGDKVQLLIPETDDSLKFRTPKSHWFEVIGSFDAIGDLNDRLGIVNPNTLNKILALDSGASTHIEFVLEDPFQAQTLVREYGYKFDQPIYMSSWFRMNGHLYYDIQLVRFVIYIVLALLICIACFNVVSSLVMSVKEKSKAIAILKTMGATETQIRQVFVLRGIRSIFLGSLFGCLVGILLSLFLPDVLNFIEQTTGLSVLNSGVYFTSTIPSQLVWWNVLVTFLFAVFIGYLATIYPARKAAKLRPALHLH
ncbi:FtsX-like permease family protein [Glaciecola sp. 1036]|uniref:FtsX-like permease family protein n=1 Tax=Alteromonadaceae TaxID=72275 RepID=UPI003D038C87